jgi:Rho-binding antiterminator
VGHIHQGEPLSDYVPIPCIAHEKLEFAVLRRQKLRLRLRQGGSEERPLTVLPTDVTTRDGAEWLTYRTEDGQTCVVRLDEILSAEPLG